MKNLQLIALSTLFISGTVILNAQNATANKRPVKQKIQDEKAIKFEELKTELKLTDEQIEKIKAIQAKKEIEKETHKEKIQEINRDEREEINQILTEEQKAALRAKRMENRKAKAVKNESPAQKVVAPKN